MSDNNHKSLQEKNTAIVFKYTAWHYFTGFLLLIGFWGSVYLFWAGVRNGSMPQTVFALAGVLLLFLSSLNFDTKITCEKAQLRVAYWFIFKRKVLWKNIVGMRIISGRPLHCKINSSKSAIPIHITVSPAHLQNADLFLETIEERSNPEVGLEGKREKTVYFPDVK